MSESLVFPVWVPVIMGLVVSVILLVRVIQITVDPGELRDQAEEVRHLGVFIGLEVVVLPHGVHLLVGVGVDDLVSEVVMPLLVIVLGEVGCVEIDNCHFFIFII